MAEIENAVKPPEDIANLVIIGKAVSPNSSAEDRIQTANILNKKITNDTEGHLNTQMQVLPMIGALLGGNLKEAYKYYNGGSTRVEDAIHPTLGRFQREYNERGPTGRIFDQNGTQLDAGTIKKLDESGGLISNTDKNAFYTGAYAAATENQKSMMTGLAKPIADQYQRSVSVAQQGTALRGLLEDRRRLVANKDNLPILTAISKLSSEDRQKLFGFVSAQSGQTGAQSREITGSESQSALRSKNAQANVALRLGGADQAAVIPGSAPPGGLLPNLASLTAGRSAGAMNQAQATESAGETTGRTSGTSESIQRNVLSEISRITQGAVQTPEQFTALQRILQNSQQIEAVRASQRPEDMAPGAKMLAPVDPLLNSPMDVVTHDIDFQRNNSLNVAWNAYLAKKMHENIRNIEPKSLDKLRDEFLSTNTFKAIQRTYDHELSRAKGQKEGLEEGALYVDRNNRLRRWAGTDWEPANAR